MGEVIRISSNRCCYSDNVFWIRLAMSISRSYFSTNGFVPTEKARWMRTSLGSSYSWAVSIVIGSILQSCASCKALSTSSILVNLTDNAISKGTKMPRGDKDSIMKYQVPIFDRTTQSKIADILYYPCFFYMFALLLAKVI